MDTNLNQFYISDKQYLELKNQQDILVGWILKIAKKTEVKINIAEFEKAI